MANQQQPDQNQQSNPSSNQQGDSLSGSIQSATPGGSEQRSEGLLPTGGQNEGQDDGRFEVAEEVSLDQQSDQLRHVGQAQTGTLPPTDDDTAAADDDVPPDPAKQSDG
jgi:hypothetical protein